ncbi:SprB repeat-containing protein, partial [Flavobacterium oreochromis]
SLDLPITIIQPDLLQVKVANPTQSVIKCYGDTSVSLQANAIGGVAPYFYKWKKNGNLISNAEFSEIKGLGAGLYEVEVKDSKGALEQAQYQVIQPQALKATYTVSPVSCANPLGGRIQLNVEGGSQPYHYKWNTNYSGTNVTPSDKFNQLTNIGLGVYNVTITDAQGCKIDLTGLQVGSSGGLELNATVKDVSCGETNNGSILINPLGGTGNYTIDWADSSF